MVLQNSADFADDARIYVHNLATPDSMVSASSKARSRAIKICCYAEEILGAGHYITPRSLSSEAVARAEVEVIKQDSTQIGQNDTARSLDVKALPFLPGPDSESPVGVTTQILSKTEVVRRNWRDGLRRDLEMPFGGDIFTIPTISVFRIPSSKEEATNPTGYILRIVAPVYNVSVERHLPDDAVYPPVLEEAVREYRRKMRDYLVSNSRSLKVGFSDDITRQARSMMKRLMRRKGLSLRKEPYSTTMRWTETSPLTVQLWSAWIANGKRRLTPPCIALSQTAATRLAMLTTLATLQKAKLAGKDIRTLRRTDIAADDSSPAPLSPQPRQDAVQSTYDIDLLTESMVPMLQTLKNVRQLGLPDHTVLPQAETRQRHFTMHALPQEIITATSASRNDELAKIMQRQTFQRKLEARSRLPMMQPETIGRILDTVEKHDVTIISASTGSGKTTQIPQILLEKAISNGEGDRCNVLCTQPRRISATSVAKRVAFERDETLGRSVGFQVRFSSHPPEAPGSITYCTTGYFLSRLHYQSEATLSQYSHIIVDEVHERDIPIDLTLAVLRSYISSCQNSGRPWPKIILMSATIDTGTLQEYYRNIPDTNHTLAVATLEIQGRNFGVQEHYFTETVAELEKLYGSRSLDRSPLHHSRVDAYTTRFLDTETEFVSSTAKIVRKLETVVAKPTVLSQQEKQEDDDHGAEKEEEDEYDALLTAKVADTEDIVPIALIRTVVAHLARTSRSGDILIFLPGFQELDRLSNDLLKRKWLGIDFSDSTKYEIFKLHSSLHEVNDTVFDPVPQGCRRIIVATNIAETSITLPDVLYVVDSGRVRQMTYDVAEDTSELSSQWISKSNSIQRRGRAGRIQPGHYYAIFSQERLQTFCDIQKPEILRTDLISACLDVKSYSSAVGISDFMSTLISPPTTESVSESIRKLQDMGALTAQEEITPLGRCLTRLPLHPYQGRLVLLGILFRCLTPALIMACHDRENNLVAHPMERVKVTESRKNYSGSARSDLYYPVPAFQEYHSAIEAGDHAFAKHLQEHRHLRPSVYNGMRLVIEQVVGVLVETGLLSAGQNAAEGIDAIPAELDVNSHQISLLKALALNTVNRKLAFWRAEPTTIKKEWLTRSTTRSLMDPRSVNQSQTSSQASFQRQFRPHGELLAYTAGKKTQGENIKWLMETTFVTHLTACLFAHTFRVSSNPTTGTPIVELDGFIRLRLKGDPGLKTTGIDPNQAGSIVIELRKAVDRFLVLACSDLKEKSHVAVGSPTNVNIEQGKSWFTMQPHACRDAMVNGLIDILNADALASENRHKEISKAVTEKSEQARREHVERHQKRRKEKLERAQKMGNGQKQGEEASSLTTSAVLQDKME